MSLIIPVGFAEVGIELRHTLDPDPWFVTFGVSFETMSAFDDVFATIEAAWANSTVLTPNTALSSSAAFTGINLRVGTATEPIILRKNVNHVGTNTGSFLPQNCAILVKKNTLLGGRRNRGRMFWPNMLDEGTVNDVGLLNPSTITNNQTSANNFFNLLQDPTVIDGAALNMHVLHSEGKSSVPPPTPVSSLTVDSVISTQRNRLR